MVEEKGGAHVEFRGIRVVTIERLMCVRMEAFQTKKVQHMGYVLLKVLRGGFWVGGRVGMGTW